jgi:hypothetical protein
MQCDLLAGLLMSAPVAVYGPYVECDGSAAQDNTTQHAVTRRGCGKLVADTAHMMHIDVSTNRVDDDMHTAGLTPVTDCMTAWHAHSWHSHT